MTTTSYVDTAAPWGASGTLGAEAEDSDRLRVSTENETGDGDLAPSESAPTHIGTQGIGSAMTQVEFAEGTSGYLEPGMMESQGALQVVSEFTHTIRNATFSSNPRSLISRAGLVLLTSFNIAKTSLLHPGRPIEINKSAGTVHVIESE